MTPRSGAYQSPWFSAGVAGIAVCLLLCLAKPAYSQEPDNYWPTPTPYYNLNVNSFANLGHFAPNIFVSAMADKWRAEADGIVRIIEASQTSSQTNSCKAGSDDGINLVVMKNANHPDGSSILGETCRFRNIMTGVIQDADIEIYNGSPPRPWTYEESDIDSSPDLYLSIEHEFGHFLGLLHAPCIPGFCEKFVMKTLGMTPRQLSTWDIAGISNRYGVRTATIKHLKSSDGITWTTHAGFVSPDTTVSPMGSVAVACAPNGNILRVIYIDTDGYLKSRWSSNRGVTWSATETIDYAGIGPHVDLSYGRFKFVATYQKYDLPSARKTRFATVPNYGSVWTLHGTAFGEASASALTTTTVFPVNQSGNPSRRFGAASRLDLNRGGFFNTKTSTDAITWANIYTPVSDPAESIAMACNSSNYCLGVTAVSSSSGPAPRKLAQLM